MNDDIKSIIKPDSNLDFELVGHSSRAGRMPVHSFKIRTTLSSGERVDITEGVAKALGQKITQAGALNEGGMGYYKPSAIAGELASALYDQNRYDHTFNVREEIQVTQKEKNQSNQVIASREQKKMIQDALNEAPPMRAPTLTNKCNNQGTNEQSQRERPKQKTRAM